MLLLVGFFFLLFCLISFHFIHQQLSNTGNLNTSLVRNIFNLLIVLFVVFFLVCVAADGNDADCWTGRVRDDDGLPGNVVLMVTGCAISLLGFTNPPAAAAAALRGQAVGRWAILWHSAAWGCVLFHPLWPLWRQHRLGWWHLVGWHVPADRQRRPEHIHDDKTPDDQTIPAVR